MSVCLSVRPSFCLSVSLSLPVASFGTDASADVVLVRLAFRAETTNDVDARVFHIRGIHVTRGDEGEERRRREDEGEEER